MSIDDDAAKQQVKEMIFSGGEKMWFTQNDGLHDYKVKRIPAALTLNTTEHGTGDRLTFHPTGNIVDEVFKEKFESDPIRPLWSESGTHGVTIRVTPEQFEEMSTSLAQYGERQVVPKVPARLLKLAERALVEDWRSEGHKNGLVDSQRFSIPGKEEGEEEGMDLSNSGWMLDINSRGEDRQPRNGVHLLFRAEDEDIQRKIGADVTNIEMAAAVNAVLEKKGLYNPDKTDAMPPAYEAYGQVHVELSLEQFKDVIQPLIPALGKK